MVRKTHPTIMPAPALTPGLAGAMDLDELQI